MREIKFRAYHHLKHRFIDIFDINCFGDVLSVGYSDLGEPGTDITNQITLDQYTGVCDEDGKELYEGDIIQVYNNVGIVEYYDIGYGLKYPDGNTIGLYSWHTKKVIGNIHENPEIVIKSLPF